VGTEGTPASPPQWVIPQLFFPILKDVCVRGIQALHNSQQMGVMFLFSFPSPSTQEGIASSFALIIKPKQQRGVMKYNGNNTGNTLEAVLFEANVSGGRGGPKCVCQKQGPRLTPAQANMVFQITPYFVFG